MQMAARSSEMTMPRLMTTMTLGKALYNMTYLQKKMAVGIGKMTITRLENMTTRRRGITMPRLETMTLTMLWKMTYLQMKMAASRTEMTMTRLETTTMTML